MSLRCWWLCAVLSVSSLAVAEDFDVKAHYTKSEHQIVMRDGVQLYTVIYSPKINGPGSTSKKYPMLMQRTPYSAGPYGAEEFKKPSSMAPGAGFLEAGYIFVFQDGRGTYKSEGEWVNLKPMRTRKSDTDESTDAYDTIDWLVKHVPNNNGRVGQWGISHPGWYTVMSMVEPHPALKAASPQATTFDPFVGDDDHHNGAFAMMGLEWWYMMSHVSRQGREILKPDVLKSPLPPLSFTTPWAYEMYLNLPPLSEVNERALGGKMTHIWQNIVDHPNYDEFWERLNVRKTLRNVKVPVLNVMGWFDSPDPYGAEATYRAIEEQNPRNKSVLVAGPWEHGGWVRTGGKLGDIRFDSNTGEYFQKNVVFPFFEYHLRGVGQWSPPEALAFETGGNRWHEFDQWPPRAATGKNLYFHADGRLSFSAPQEGGNANDSYLSDPAKPVPYTSVIERKASPGYMVGDQRYAYARPDVLTYQTEVLTEDMTIAGPIPAQLFASTTGTDSDWFVKLIDVYPDDFPQDEKDPQSAPMGGYQMMVGFEVMRGKYRNSFAKPEAMVPDQVTPIRFEIRDKFHTFKKGHRIMVQVQSSFFPAIDRNPQIFTDIYRAQPEQYQKAMQKVYRSAQSPSHVVLPVIPAGALGKP
ncbi:CocE/NonD family hydrolase [Steroidobacter sp.]|uniref:CocE/NonD family hydrolase n=1 Tax=Steroidobacter sp. TaxID=1978227 RepID=UPI001A4AD5F3|nr:CocE/NonD family hydrolase [Steroidobacter sp.]MBL8271471.1 CocE/NonD family hydrolase [Steroidobacter sp.]